MRDVPLYFYPANEFAATTVRRGEASNALPTDWPSTSSPFSSCKENPPLAKESGRAEVSRDAASCAATGRIPARPQPQGYWKWLLPCVLVGLLLSGQARADKVDDLVKREMQRLHIPGLSLLVTKNDAPIKRTAYGEANLELHVPATPDNLFESGSIGKTLTATIVMQLVEAGKIALDDPVSKYFKEAPPAWSGIAIKNLLSHTSGLKDYATVPGLYLTDTWTRDDWLKKMPTLPLDFAPGTAWAYSNTNYYLLGIIVERLLGKPYADIMTERVLTPLGMNHSLWSTRERIIEKRAAGYFTLEGHIINSPPITTGGGDGGLIHPADDLAKFEAGLREGKLVKPETLKTMQTRFRLNNGRNAPYGFGWFVRKANRHVIYSHGGNTAGYAASLTRLPEEKLTVVVMCNIYDVSGDELAQKIAQLYAPEIAPQKLKEVPDPAPTLSQQLRDTLIGLAKGNIRQDTLDPDYAAKLATPRGQMGLATLAAFAAPESFAYLETEPDDPDRILRYRVRIKQKSFVVAFVLTAQNKVYGVGTREES